MCKNAYVINGRPFRKYGHSHLFIFSFEAMPITLHKIFMINDFKWDNDRIELQTNDIITTIISNSKNE